MLDITRGGVDRVRATYLYAMIPTGVETEVIRVACRVNECAISKA